MRVLVTGAAGFIGAHVVRELISRGDHPYALVRPGSASHRLDDLGGRVSIIEADLADPARVTAALGDVQPDAVIHLAWYAEPGRYRAALAENLASLQVSAGLLLAAAEHGCPRVVLGGTCLENADSPPQPQIYEAAKAALHRLSDGFASSTLSVACGHVFYLYGPGEDERRAIPSVIRALLSGKEIATTDGQRPRDYLYVSDVAAAFCTLAGSTRPGGVDICSGSLVTLADVFRTIADRIGRPDLLRLGALGPTGDDGYARSGDAGTLRGLGWGPTRDLRAGIDETIAWWRTRLEDRS